MLSSVPLGLKDLLLPMTTTRHCAIDFKIMAFRGATLQEYKTGPIETPIQGSHVFAGESSPAPIEGPPSVAELDQPSSSNVQGPTRLIRPGSEGLMPIYERIDKNMKRFVTTEPGGPDWDSVVQRIVIDVDTRD
jgi:hypothetical protein